MNVFLLTEIISYDSIAYYLQLAIFCAVVLFLFLDIYYVLYFIEAFRKPKKFAKGEKLYKFAVFVPARNEDKVISHVLESLKNQDYNKDFYDVYVIIESRSDPTYNIAKKYGAKPIIRKDLVNKRTKGFAIAEGLKYLKDNNLVYDELLIFDADNIVSSDYISHMNDVRNQGYQVGVGYRNFTNSKKNWISACSATLFSFMNQFTSKGRSRYYKKATITGTGYYIDMQVIEDAGGWIWTGMTEDVALTTYCYYHNVHMHYYPYAVYYDEQPTKYKAMHKQHIRWCFGFTENKKKYKKGGVIYHKEEKAIRRCAIMEYTLSIRPFVTFVVTELVAFLVMLALTITAAVIDQSSVFAVGIKCLWNFLLLYGTFMLTACIALGLDNKNLKFNFWYILMVVISYMFFFGDFLLAFIDGGIHKNKRREWVKIEHTGDITNQELMTNESESKD